MPIRLNIVPQSQRFNHLIPSLKPEVVEVIIVSFQAFLVSFALTKIMRLIQTLFDVVGDN